MLPGGSPEIALKLLDSGNAVLIDTAGTIIWESFQHPTDTFLPGMKMDTNLKLTSWRSVDDPTPGSFEFQQEETTQYTIFDTDVTRIHWKSGSGSMKNYDPSPFFNLANSLLTNSSDTNACKLNPSTRKKSFKYRNITICFAFKNYTRLLMSYTGNIRHFSRAEHDEQWYLDWQVPKDNCSIYGVCGKFGLCNVSDHYTCSCLPGFEPIAPGHYYSGCKRTFDICGSDFINISMIKVENPITYFKSNNESYCKEKCLQNCDCNAYSYTLASGELARSGLPGNICWHWDSDLNNLQTGGTKNIFIRVEFEAGTLLKLYILYFLQLFSATFIMQS